MRYQQFRVDQLVWLYWPRPLIRSSHRKLVKLWTGPWRILRFDSPLVVQIKHTTFHKKQTVHMDRLMPCRAPENQPEGDLSVTEPQSNEHQNTSIDSTAEVESPNLRLLTHDLGVRYAVPQDICNRQSQRYSLLSYYCRKIFGLG